MRTRSALASLLFLVIAAAPAFASFGGGSKDEPPTPSRVEPGQAPPTSRQEAERLYADAYDEVAKANKDLADDKKKKNAEKKFKKALDRGERAAGLDSMYHEAWNLVGYCARNLGQYDKSLAAYTRCLTIKPDYAAAREYLGELYVEMGDLAKARQQIIWLERLNASDGLKTLKQRIDAWAAAHPDSGATTKPAEDSVPVAPTPASRDSSGTPGSGGTEP
jgi:tetratricopeptide (TPR) repeat protein